MEQSHQEGWNYEFAKTGENDKNIFFFRDTSHISPKIQQKLYQEAKEKITNNFFEKIAIEGWSGYFLHNIKPKKDKKQHVIKLLHSHFYKKNLLYGIDDDKLLELSKRYIYQISELHTSIKKNKTSEKINDLNDLKNIFSEISRGRSFRAVENTVKYMEKENINNIGCIFGEGHFKDMTLSFRNRNIGIISYFPGNTPKHSEEEVKRYYDSIKKP